MLSTIYFGGMVITGALLLYVSRHTDAEWSWFDVLGLVLWPVMWIWVLWKVLDSTIE